MKSLENKVAVITGATSGMALATAKLFASEGAYVYITGRNQDKLDDAIKAIGANAKGIQGDAAKLEDLDRLFETVKLTTSESSFYILSMVGQTTVPSISLLVIQIVFARG